MARVYGSVTTEGELSLTAATEKTLIQVIAASGHRAVITGWGVSFNGVTSTNEPVKVRIAKQTTAGTVTAATPVKKNSGDDETLQTTAGKNATAEPTTTDTYRRIEIHPQGGSYSEYFPQGQEIPVVNGGRVGILANAPQTVSVLAWVDFEE